MVPRTIPANVAVLMDALAAGIPTYAITNFAADTFAEACEIYPSSRGLTVAWSQARKSF